MKWQDLTETGMDKLFYIMSVEWFVTIIVAYCIDVVFSSGKSPFLFFKKPFKKSSSLPSPSVQRQSSDNVLIDMEKTDVTQEVWEKRISNFLISFHVSQLEVVLIKK